MEIPECPVPSEKADQEHEDRLDPDGHLHRYLAEVDRFCDGLDELR